MRIAVHTGDFGHVFNFTLVARGRRCDFMRLTAVAKGLLNCRESGRAVVLALQYWAQSKP